MRGVIRLCTCSRQLPCAAVNIFEQGLFCSPLGLSRVSHCVRLLQVVYEKDARREKALEAQAELEVLKTANRKARKGAGRRSN